MSEEYRIVEVRDEPLPAGCAGVRVRVRLSSCPTRQWSRDVSARLASELIGHAAAGRLRLNELVQGDQLVLEGVEASEAPALAAGLERAIDATNQALAAGQSSTADVAPEAADAVAGQIAPEPRSALTSARSREAKPSAWFG